MVKIKKEELLITPEHFKPSHKSLEIMGTFNPAAVRLNNGDILLYVRVQERLKDLSDRHHYFSPRCVSNTKFKLRIDKIKKSHISHVNDKRGYYFYDETLRLTYISHFRRVILDKDAKYIKFIDKKPSFYGTANDGEFGVEDPRIVRIDNKYVMTYVSLSKYKNVSTSMATSTDGIRWKRQGVAFRQQNKDVVLFPEKINGKYMALNRPEGNFQFSQPHIWTSYSPDLIHWGHGDILLMPSQNSWDAGRIGAGAPPVKIKQGWLAIYHGIKRKCKDDLRLKKCVYEYCAGAMLLNKKNPTKVIAKSPTNMPLLSPTQEYEIKGDMPRVIFPTGLLEDSSKENVLIFSGGADTVTTLKIISIKEILNHLRIK